MHHHQHLASSSLQRDLSNKTPQELTAALNKLTGKVRLAI
jgi:hypothetical protein